MIIRGTNRAGVSSQVRRVLGEQVTGTKLFLAAAGEAMWKEVGAGEPAEFAVIVLYGTIPSIRSKSMRAKDATVKSHMIRNLQEEWFRKLSGLGMRHHLAQIVCRAAADGFKTKITVDVRRRIPIRDYKDLVGGVDEILFDGWKRGGILIDDCMQAIQVAFDENAPEQGQDDYVWVRFERGSGQCSEAVTQRAVIALEAMQLPSKSKEKNERLFGIRGN